MPYYCTMCRYTRAGSWSALFLGAFAAIALLAAGCSESTGPEPEPWVIKSYTYSVVDEFPHDTGAFTQGLVFESDGYLYEGTGLWGQSTLRKVSLTTGAVVDMRSVPARPGGSHYFGEGITIFNSKVYQLTWQDHVGFIYDQTDFDSIGQFSYQTEGWGLTHDGQRFIMSTGRAYLYFRNLSTMAVLDSVFVHDTVGAVSHLNELEYIDGEVWANIWLTNRIARIDPASGRVLGYVELQGLLTPEEAQSADVLNGIAYDAANGRIFVTGKKWPKVFEILVTEEQ